MKVQDSWANQLDQMKANWEAFKLSVTTGFMEGSGNLMISGFNFIADGFRELSKESHSFNIAVGGLFDFISLFSIASILNLNKVKNAIGALTTSLATLNPAVLAIIAIVMGVSAISRGINAYVKDIEESAELSLQQAKALEESSKAIKTQSKRIEELMVSIDNLSTEEAIIKIQSLTNEVIKSTSSFKGLEDAIKAMSDLSVKMSIPIDTKRFTNDIDKIIFTGIFEGKTIQDFLKNTNIETGSEFKQKIYKTQKAMGKNGNYEKARAIVVEEIKAIMKEVDNLQRQYKFIQSTKIKPKISPVEITQDMSGDTLKKALKHNETIAKINADSEKSNKEYKEYLSSLKKELKSYYDILSTYGVDKAKIYIELNKQIADITKNTADMIEVEVKRIQEIKDTLEIVASVLKDKNVELINQFMKKSSFSTVDEFKKAMESQGLSDYTKLLKEFGNTIDSFQSQSGKVAFLKGEFMDMVGTIRGLTEIRSGAKSIFDDLGKTVTTSGKTLSQIYGNKALEDKLTTDEKDKLNQMKSAQEQIKNADIVIAKVKENAKIQEKSFKLLQAYNSTYDEQVLSLSKINASKLQSLNIDRQMLDTAYKQSRLFDEQKLVATKALLRQEYKPDGKNKNGIIFGKIKVDLSNIENVKKVLENLSGGKNRTEEEERFFLSLNDYYEQYMQMQEKEVKYKQDSMNIDKESFTYKKEILDSYVAYLTGVDKELEELKTRKTLLEKSNETETDTFEKLKNKVEISSLGLQIKLKEEEVERKILDLKREQERYDIRRQVLFGTSLDNVQKEYDFEKKLLDNAIKKLEDKKLKMENKFTNPEAISEAKIVLINEMNKLASKAVAVGVTKVESEFYTKQIEDLNHQFEIIMKLESMTASKRKEYLENNVEYQQILADLSKKGFELNELDLKTWKERLSIETQLLELSYDRNRIQSESQKERSRNLYKEVFGTQKYDKQQFDIERATQKGKLTSASKSLASYVNKARSLGKTDEELAKDVEYLKLSNNLEQESLNLTKLINEQEKQRLEMLKQEAEMMVNFIDSLSKGEVGKFNASQAIGGLEEPIVKLKDGKALDSKDYGKIAMAGVGIATNIINQSYDSAMNVVSAELNNLEMRKQIARSDEERQQIDKEILEQQKKQIDLQYKQSTQAVGVTGIAGSGLGGALSGLQVGMATGDPYIAAATTVLGGISGIISGSSAKKQAEAQKRALENQMRTNNYLESMRNLMEASNKLVEGIYNFSNKGFNQAMKDAMKEFKQTQTEKGLFDITSAKEVGKFHKWSTGKTIASGLGIEGDTYTDKNALERDILETVGNTLSSIQSQLTSLNFGSTEGAFTKIKSDLADFKSKIEKFYKATSSNADDLLLEQIANWEAYVKTLEIIAFKKDVFYSAYFGFEAEYIKDKAGFITEVLVGEWEKRTDFLDQFVSDALSQEKNISATVGRYMVESFANAFIRNKTELEAELTAFEENVKKFASAMSNKQNFNINEMLKAYEAQKNNQVMTSPYYAEINAMQNLIQSQKDFVTIQKEVTKQL